MGPTEDRPGELMRPQARAAVPLDAVTVQTPVAVPRAAGAPATIVSPAPANVAEVTGMLLPTEYVTFATSPHPIVLVRPVAGIVVILAVLGALLACQTHPIVNGHHRTVPLLTGVPRTAVLVIGMLLLLNQLTSLLRRLFHYLAYRVVTTNRRAFVVTGLFGRRVTPLGNTAMAGATMAQGMLGRMFGFGDVVFASGGTGAIRAMRDPVRLYRELEAIANGVDGKTWQQPIRQTIIP
jgi:Bacterial PH domain